MYFKHLFEGKLKQLLTYIYPETLIAGLIMAVPLFVDKNRHFLIVYLLLFIVFYFVSGKLINTIWYTFLAIFPFGVGRYFEYDVISTSLWGGGKDLGFSIPLLFSDILLLFMVYLLIKRWWKRKNSFHLSTKYYSAYIWLILFLIIAGFSVFISSFQITSTFYFLQLTKMITLFLVAREVFLDKSLLKKSIQILSLFVVLNSVLIIVQFVNNGPLGLKVEDLSALYGWYADENPGLYRPGGLYSDPNIAGTLIASFYPIFLLGTLFSKKLKDISSWLVLALISVALILTGSRSSWLIAFMISFISIRIFSKKHKIHIPDIIKKYKVAIVIILLIIFGPLIIKRSFTLVDAFSRQGGGTFRLEQIKVSWRYSTNRLFGTGIGTYPYAMISDYPFNKYGFTPTYPHNIFAQISAETGIFGIIFFVLFIANLFRVKYITLEKKDVYKGSLLLAGLSILLLSNLFPWVLHPKMASFFWILLAI